MATKSSRLSSLRSRATSKAAAPAVAALTPTPAPEPAPEPAPAPALSEIEVAVDGVGERVLAQAVAETAIEAAAEAVQAPLAPTKLFTTPLSRVTVAEAVQAQYKRLKATGSLNYFIDYTDADGGMSTRLRTTIHVSPEALAAVQELRLAEEGRFGKAPRLYHYVELALLWFMPTPEDAASAAVVDVPVYEPISTAITREAKMVMVSTRKVRNDATGKAVVKHWFYSQALLRMVSARRAALDLH